MHFKKFELKFIKCVSDKNSVLKTCSLYEKKAMLILENRSSIHVRNSVKNYLKKIIEKALKKLWTREATDELGVAEKGHGQGRTHAEGS